MVSSVSLQGVVWVYIFMRWWLADWARSVLGSLGHASEVQGTPVDHDCICCDELAAGIGICGVYDVAAGAAGATVIGLSGGVDLTARVEGKDVDVVGATSLVDGHVGSDGIWVTCMNVINSTLVLSSANDLY